MNLKLHFKNRLSRSLIPILDRLVMLIIGSFILNSCGNMKDATYFSGTQNTKFMNNYENWEPVIKPNDMLSIMVSSVNPEASEIFNVSNTNTSQSSTVSGTTAQVSGYLVDQDGFIRFPILGNIKATGITKNKLREEITKQLEERKLLIGPIVDIRYLNFKVSILGEVKDPSVLTIPDEKISIFEALGLAGDITVYGNRKNVSIIREGEYGVKTLYRIDLTTNEIFTSPYYYLRPNDVVYVEANKSKIASSSQARLWIPVLLSTISLAIITITAF
ncbi:polysaccharide export outer membrane protein [Arenibacter algicola]|uniref:Polysaccharide export outer membrane protein n=1 Tax=Arenibacter algicola TaxID=616991 RepID=A0ABY3ADK6_9FLAO